MKLSYPKLFNVELVPIRSGRSVIAGNIFNDKRFEGGTLIHTAEVLQVFEEQGELVAKTKNTTYLIDKETCVDYNDLKEIENGTVFVQD